MKAHIGDKVHSVFEFLTHLFVNYPEGMFLYMFSAATINILNLVYKHVWDKGSLGSNGLWDIPEQLMVVGPKWIYPHILCASVFLPEVCIVPPWAAWFMGANILFALTGRWGLEALVAFKNGGTIKSITNESSVIRVTKEESKVDSTSNTTDTIQ